MRKSSLFSFVFVCACVFISAFSLVPILTWLFGPKVVHRTPLNFHPGPPVAQLLQQTHLNQDYQALQLYVIWFNSIQTNFVVTIDWRTNVSHNLER